MTRRGPAYGGQEAIDRMNARLRIGPGTVSSEGKVIGRSGPIIVEVDDAWQGHALRAEHRGDALVLTSRGWDSTHYVGDDCEPDGHRGSDPAP